MEIEMNRTESSSPLDPEEEMKKDAVKYFGFQPKRDSASDARNALLVVAALVATVTLRQRNRRPWKHPKWHGQNYIHNRKFGCFFSIDVINCRVSYYRFPVQNRN